MWTPVELIRWTSGFLAEKGVEDSRLTAEHLLADALGLKRLDLYLQFDRPLSTEELDGFRESVKRKARREPLQYIAGTADFREITLRVDRRVLVPRPETELLVGEVLRRFADRPGADLLDIGTGTGAIALSVDHEGDFGRIVATDVSSDALDVARWNCAKLSAGECGVDFRLGSAYDPVAGERFDVVVSNPPYIAERERPRLEPEVREWEPPLALFAGEDGLAVIREIVGGAADHLRAGGLLAVEIGADQGRAVTELAAGQDGLTDVEIVPDLAGRERFLIARRR